MSHEDNEEYDEEPEKAELTKLLEELFNATKTAEEIAARIDPFVESLLKFKWAIESALNPNTELHRELKQKTKQVPTTQFYRPNSAAIVQQRSLIFQINCSDQVV